MSDGLTPEEIKFFETGDASVLALSDDAPAPAPETVVETAAEPTPIPSPAPVDTGLAAQQEADRAFRAQLEAQLQQINARLERAAAPPPKAPDLVPDLEKDPYGHLMHKIQSIENALLGMHQRTEQTQQQAVQQQQFAALKAQVTSERDSFSAKTPDFSDAYQHLRNARAADLRDVGVPEHKIAEALLTDELAVAQNAMAQGRNSAEVIYNMAKRYGYVPRLAAPSPANPVARVAQIIEGQKAADTVPKAAASGELSLAALKDASDADLNKVAMDDKLWRQVMGGGQSDIFHR